MKDIEKAMNKTHHISQWEGSFHKAINSLQKEFSQVSIKISIGF